MTDYVYEVTDLPASPGPTPWQTVGPFFHGALVYAAGPQVAGAERPGALTLRGHVYDGQGDSVPDALVEVWQPDESGAFVAEPRIYEPPTADGFRGFGRCPTDEDGNYAFTTVRPGGVPADDGADPAPYLAMSVLARGMLRRAVTRVYFDDAPQNAADPLLAGLGADRAATLVATSEPGGYLFEVRLHGADETVFLDVSPH